MAGGIAPSVLIQQVEQTARWALQPRDEVAAREPFTADQDAFAWRDRLGRALELEASYAEPGARLEYFSLLLSAHFCTVGTFVPTDVDTRIRFHAWQECKDKELLTMMLARVDQADRWDPTLVSARVVDVGLGALSGHNGEWFSVRAGALGRALQLKHESAIEQLTAQLDAELSRESQCFERVEGVYGSELAMLRVACVIAHNLGDLSRVVADWPVKSARAEQLRQKYARLGHHDSSNEVGPLRRAGALNKSMMASENHRFLALRRPRGLRKHRGLLLPMGPFFDAWGATIATHKSLTAGDRAEVIDALVDAHLSDPSQQGYLRALAGIHQSVRGGLDEAARELPAKQRRHVAAGAIREALGVTQERFEARVAKRARDVLKTLR